MPVWFLTAQFSKAADWKKAGLRAIRLLFTTENGVECVQVLEAYRGRGNYIQVPDLGQLQLKGGGDGLEAQPLVLLHPLAVEHLEAEVPPEGEAQLLAQGHMAQIAHVGVRHPNYIPNNFTRGLYYRDVE